MNIMDFVDSLKIQLSDIESIGELGLKPSDHFIKTQLALAMSHGVTLTLCKDDYINLTDQVLSELFHTKILNLSNT